MASCGEAVAEVFSGLTSTVWGRLPKFVSKFASSGPGGHAQALGSRPQAQVWEGTWDLRVAAATCPLPVLIMPFSSFHCRSAPPTLFAGLSSLPHPHHHFPPPHPTSPVILPPLAGHW